MFDFLCKLLIHVGWIFIESAYKLLAKKYAYILRIIRRNYLSGTAISSFPSE